MNNFEYEKSVIGQILGYYRKCDSRKLKTILYNEGEFFNEYCLNCLKCKNNTTICSPNTLYKIERGNIVDDECVYYRLSEVFNKKFLLTQDLCNKLTRYRATLVKNLASRSYTDLVNLLNELENELIMYENVIYFGEFFQLYKNAIQTILDMAYPTNEELYFYLYLKNLVNLEDKKIILLLLYDASYVKKLDFLNRSEIINESTIYFDDELFFRMRLNHLVRTDKKKAIRIMEKYELERINGLGLFQQYVLHDSMALMYVNMEMYSLAYEKIMICCKIVEEYADFGDFIKESCYRKISIVSFLLGKYSDTAKYLLHIVSDSKNSIGINYAILFYSLEKLKQESKIIETIQSINLKNIQNKYEKMIVKYYKLKYSTTNPSKEHLKMLETMLYEELVQIIIVGGKMYEKVFREEILNLVTITSNYKSYYLFDYALNNRD